MKQEMRQYQLQAVAGRVDSNGSAMGSTLEGPAIEL